MIMITLFGICKESMISVENLEKWCEGGDTVPGTQSSHHFVPLSSSRIGRKLINEDESYVDIHGFNVSTLFEIGDISPSAYVICIYNSFWWVGMVSLVHIFDIRWFSWYWVMLLILISRILKGQERPLISINVVLHVMFLWKTFFKRYQLLLHLLGEPTR